MRFSVRNAVRPVLQARPSGIRDSLRQGASQAAGAAPTLRYGPAGDSAPRLRLRRLVWPKGSLSARQARPENPPPAVSFWAHRYL